MREHFHGNPCPLVKWEYNFRSDKDSEVNECENDFVVLVSRVRLLLRAGSALLRTGQESGMNYVG